MDVHFAKNGYQSIKITLFYVDISNDTYIIRSLFFRAYEEGQGMDGPAEDSMEREMLKNSQ